LPIYRESYVELKEGERKEKKKEWLAEAKPKILHKQAPPVKRTLTRMPKILHKQAPPVKRTLTRMPKILHKQAPPVKRTLTRMILTISRKGAS
jgi:hypothetical protein